MKDNNIEIKAVDVLSNKDSWIFQMKNIGVMFILCIPLILAVNLDLSNTFHAIGFICIILIIVFALFLKIGNDSLISFRINEIEIVKNNSNDLIPKEDINELNVINFSGSKAPFVIEINLKNGDKMKYSVDKFNFQNPRAIYLKLLDSSEWKDLIKINAK